MLKISNTFEPNAKICKKYAKKYPICKNMQKSMQKYAKNMCKICYSNRQKLAAGNN